MVQRHQGHTQCSCEKLIRSDHSRETIEFVLPIAHRRSRLVLALDQLIGREYPIIVIPIGIGGRHGKVCSILLSNSRVVANNASREKRLVPNSVSHHIDIFQPYVGVRVKEREEAKEVAKKWQFSLASTSPPSRTLCNDVLESFGEKLL